MAFIPEIAEAVAGGAEAAGAEEGASAVAGDEEGISEMPHDIGGGDTLQFDAEQFRQFLWSDASLAAIKQRADEICALANSTAITKGAVYAVTSPTEGAVTRPRANVWTKNYKAVIDDYHHATLLKAIAQFPSDPKPESYGEGEGEPGEESEAPDAGGEETEGGEEAAEAGEAGEVAEVAIVAL
jgi:hypothetical protein